MKVAEGRPWGGTFRPCEGRLRSGAPPPPTARPLGGLSGSSTHALWARVCGCRGPAVSPWLACPVGAACRGGGGGPSPGGVDCHCCEGCADPADKHTVPLACAPCGGCVPWGRSEAVPERVACHRCRGRRVSGAVPPPAARALRRAAGVPRPVCPGCGWCGRGDPSPAPQRAPLWAGVARCGGGGRASPGGGAFRRCDGRLRSGTSPPRLPALRAGSRGSATRVSRARLVRAWGPCTGPTVCSLAGRRCTLWGWRKGVPGGGTFSSCEGRLRSGAPPSLAARPLSGLSEAAVNVLWARVYGCGGPALSPWPPCSVGAVCRMGWWRAVPGGGWPGTVVRGVWCQALSLPRPPVLWGGRPGVRDPCVPGAVGVGVETLHRPHSVRPCEPALPAVGMAEGRPRGGCLSLS